MQSSADEDETDPFELHFANPDEDELSNKIKAAQENSWTPQKLSPSADYKMTGQYPGNFTPRHVPGVEGLVDKGFNIKPRLSEASRKLLKKATALEQALFPIIFDNQDLLFGARTPSNADRLRNLVSLHALNHLYKTRDRIIKNNTKLARDKTGSLELRDQGFTRPKVLILTATRSACYKIVQAMLAIASPEQQENKKRFEDAFILDNPIPSDRPADYIDLFAGNNDDEFRVGMKFTRKTVKFFSKFANSDIILASPLGLRRSLTTTDKKGSPPNTDFLSSIEICIVDQADALLMQNWDHLTHIFTHLNALPRNPAGTDFSRVRNWCLNAHSPFLRQTILLAAYLTPDLNALFTAHMRNIAGRVKICPANYPGHLAVPMPIKQTFNRIAAPSPLAAPDTRFAHFCTAIVPALAARSKRASANSSTTAAGTLVCVPSYYDFVRLRNFFATSTAAQNISFGAISEYSSPTQVRQARSHFGTGRFSVLLYSGRAHHFQRYRIRGVRSVVWYGVPDNAVFYGEGLEMVLASVEKGVVGVGEARVRMLFTRWDGLGLERVVGSERVRGMVGEAMGDVFEFV
ncbi:DUF1253-domain-containing protein [Pseudovirgaria hyperparasitica]|uniref:U3 small nucleolar RNA-associated protein 25 n=1 Tax=Pseudovirgaria hyperparasitica TaxID=470096 RepID=A0A6A6WC02_9PEZI|nr:DUF1253-domain-containing protein [Pseudovirgaria hyperparasitica]KAF2759699.1 DUF1253-domain-containing protein [Pseudovirgaria hyperparasitica]